jgi:hypothetical protein
MPTLTIPNSFSPSTTAQSAQVNANFNAVATLLNSTKLDVDNIQALGITTALLAANAVTGAKLNSDVVDNSTLQYTSSQLSIKALGVGTSHIAAGAVTQAKRADLGEQLSTASGSFTTSSATLVDVTNLSVSITTTGRRVWVGLIPDSAQTTSSLSSVTTSGTDSASGYALFRDSTQISAHDIENRGASAGSLTARVPVGTVFTLDKPIAGTYTYKLQCKATNANTAAVTNAILVAYEL